MDLISTFLGHGANLLWLMVAMPAGCGIVLWLSNLLAKKSAATVQLILVAVSAGANLALAIGTAGMQGFKLLVPFAGDGLDLALTVSRLSSVFLVLAAAGFLLAGFYCAAAIKGRSFTGRLLFYMYLSLAMINGALLSDNLGIMLFFWEGLMCTLFGILLINQEHKPQLPVKALVISAVSNLLLMLGILITVYQAGTPLVSEMSKMPAAGLPGLGFALMMLGAAGKIGSVPFHSWLPGAANHAVPPFMALFPSMLDPILGTFLLARIMTGIFDLQAGSGLSVAIMLFGILTALAATLVALAQKDIRRLLTYHTIGQAGLILFSFGTASTAGLMGGIFLVIVQAAAKSCLFMAAGSLGRIPGKAIQPEPARHWKSAAGLTLVCALASAAALAGLPPFGGAFTLRLVVQAAYQAQVIWLVGVLAVLFLSAVVLLKVANIFIIGAASQAGHTVRDNETGSLLLVPMGILALSSLAPAFIGSWLQNRVLAPAAGSAAFISGWPDSIISVVWFIIPALAAGLAALNHFTGSKKEGWGTVSSERITSLPGIRQFLKSAEKHKLDPHIWLESAANSFARLCARIEQGVSWFYDKFTVNVFKGAGNVLHKISNGSLSRYLMYAVGGVAAIGLIFVLFLLG